MIRVALLALLPSCVFVVDSADPLQDADTLPVAGEVLAVVVASDAGDVLVRGEGACAGVDVRRVYTEGDDPAVTAELVDGTLTIDVVCPAGTGFGDQCAATVELVVPPGTPVEIVTGAGDVDLVGLGDVGAVTGAGSVSVDATAGGFAAITASTGAGDVTIEVPAGAYAIDAGTGAGDLVLADVTDDDGAEAAISAHSGAGDVAIRGR